MEPQAFEARGRRHPDRDVVYSQAQPEEELDLDDLSLPAISRFLDRGVRAGSADLNEILVSSDKVLILGILSNGIALAESAQRLLADRRAVEGLEITARLFEASCLAMWLRDNQELCGEWFEEWLRLSNADKTDLHRAGVSSGRRSDEDAVAEPLDDSAPKASLIPWPPTEDWLRDQAAATDRRRAWWLWRLNRSISWSVLSLQSRVLEGDALRFSTREPSLDDLAEVAAFVIESLAVLRSSCGRILGLSDPDQLANNLLEARRVLESLPRPATEQHDA